MRGIPAFTEADIPPVVNGMTLTGAKILPWPATSLRPVTIAQHNKQQIIYQERFPKNMFSVN